MSLYSNIFDAHAHYDDKWFDDDRFELLENIHTKGVCGIVNNAVDLETAKTCIEYAEKYDFMYAAVGFHPENLENIPDNLDRAVRAIKKDSLIHRTLGSHAFMKYVAYKQKEWNQYRNVVTEWEIKNYLSRY